MRRSRHVRPSVCLLRLVLYWISIKSVMDQKSHKGWLFWGTPLIWKESGDEFLDESFSFVIIRWTQLSNIFIVKEGLQNWPWYALNSHSNVLSVFYINKIIQVRRYRSSFSYSRYNTESFPSLSTNLCVQVSFMLF